MLVDGGPGDDYIHTNRGRDRVVLGGEGDDVILTGSAPDGTLNSDGSAAADAVVDGGPGNDIILGGGSQDRLSGGDGNDTLYGGASAGTDDLYDCGAGYDTVFVDRYELLALPSLLRLLSSAGCERTILSDPSIADVRFDGLRGARHLGKETGGAAGAAILEAIAVQSDQPDWNGTTGNDDYTGSILADSINGQDGDDTLRGGVGSDDIRGDDGNDRIFGDAGTGGGADVVDCGPGFDRVFKDRTDRVVNCESVG